MRELLAREGANTIFDRRCRVTVDGYAMEGLRVGFTIEKDLKPTPNTCSVVIYNLARSTRQRLHKHRTVPVVVEAGYRTTGRSLLFAGEMREAESTPEADGTWATTLRAGDGDKALRGARSKTGLRPGISVERVMSEQFKALGVGIGNAWTELKKQIATGDFEAERIGGALDSGFNASGATTAQLDKVMKGAGLEYSVQDGQLQVLKKGQVLSTRATILSPGTGLEGTPSVDAQGTMNLRARLVPGLFPGYPIQVTRYAREDLRDFSLLTGHDITRHASPLDDETVWRIEKSRFIGDTHGADWVAECECRDVKAGPETKKKVKRK